MVSVAHQATADDAESPVGQTAGRDSAVSSRRCRSTTAMTFRISATVVYSVPRSTDRNRLTSSCSRISAGLPPACPRVVCRHFSAVSTGPCCTSAAYGCVTCRGKSACSAHRWLAIIRLMWLLSLHACARRRRPATRAGGSRPSRDLREVHGAALVSTAGGPVPGADARTALSDFNAGDGMGCSVDQRVT